jgi:hypothetical protein
MYDPPPYAVTFQLTVGYMQEPILLEAAEVSPGPCPVAVGATTKKFLKLFGESLTSGVLSE